jgi:hypothetical protein
MKSQVKHICLSPLGNSLYIPFSNSILVVCTNTAKREFLLLTFTVVFERSQCKYSIVQVILFTLILSCFAIDFKCCALLIVLFAVVEYWQKLKFFPLA